MYEDSTLHSRRVLTRDIFNFTYDNKVMNDKLDELGKKIILYLGKYGI